VIRVAAVPFASIQPQLAALSAAHHAEAAADFPLAIDWHLLDLMAKTEALVAIAAMDGDEVRAYCLLILQRHAFAGELWAQQIALYTVPASRGLLSLRLLAFVEAEMCRRNVAVVAQSVPHLSTAGALMERLGYVCRELVMVKRL
jgi:hypothetical protein